MKLCTRVGPHPTWKFFAGVAQLLGGGWWHNQLTGCGGAFGGPGGGLSELADEGME